MNQQPDLLNSEAATCQHCGETFKPREGSGGSKQKFCSPVCRTAFRTKPEVPSVSQRVPACAVVPDAGNNEDFDWSNDSSVVLHEQPETAIYFNKYGTLVIRQREWPDQDSFVYIAETNIGDFLDRLTDICGVPSFGKP